MMLPIFALLGPSAAHSGAAQLFIHPTFVELNDRQRNATVTIVNRGDAAGAFAIDWVDYAMTEEGGLTAMADNAPWSLQPHIRYSPRRVTLRPGETQIVRLALRRPTDVTEAEYYSHLKVVILNDDVDAAERPSAGDNSIVVAARTAISIPVIWRHGRAEPGAAIESVEIDAERRAVHVTVSRVGQLSTRGFLHLVQVTDSGARKSLAEPVPFVIYPSVAQRRATIALRDGQELDAGSSVEVVYSPDIELKRAGPMLDSYTFAP